MATAFRLETSQSGLATLRFDLPDKRVNLFTREVMEELAELVASLAQRRDVQALILLSAKPDSFCHGAQVDRIGALADAGEAEAASRAGQEIFRAWSALPFPTIAAIDATAMGGGVEIAIASTFRVVSDHPGVRLGLPEVRIGILPAWGGCTRLPRLIGLPEALAFILSGKSVPAKKAMKLGLVDAILPHAGFLHHVRDFALARRGQLRRPESEHDLKELLLEKNPLGRHIVFDQAKKRALAATRGKYPAPLATIEVVKTSIEHGPDAGFEAEAKALGELATSSTTRNLIHLFTLGQAAKRPSAEEHALAPPPLEHVAVAGAGLMGAGIAQVAAQKAAVAVRLFDASPAAVSRALADAAEVIANRVKRRRMEPAEARAAAGRLVPALELASLAQSELVIEAVSENLVAKRQLLAELAAVVPASAVLASNTSSLSIAALAATTPRPERVVGLHFFNPVALVPLVEVVSGPATDERTLAIATSFVRRLDKTPVRVLDCPGFLVNRLLARLLTEALWLLAEGTPIETIDETMLAWGLPVGPIALLDRIGVDVALTVARGLAAAYADRVSLPELDYEAAFLAHGRLGAKTGAGFYHYAEGKPTGPDLEALERLRRPGGQRAVDGPAIADRLILPMVDEAARCLAQGVVDGPGTLDLAAVLGLGFPPFLGGPCRWAEGRGLAAINGRLTALAETCGARFSPGEALREAERAGGFDR